MPTSDKSVAEDKTQQRPTAETASTAIAPGATIFSFNAFHVLGVSFQQVPSVPLAEGEQPPSVGQDTQIGVSAGVGITAEKIGQLRLVVTVVPNPKTQPYNITVDVQGTFSTETGTPEQLAAFCRMNAAAILFPYIREIIDRVTLDGPYGAVRLNPMNITELLNQTPWGEAQGPIVSSIVPVPPVAQSDDASRT